MGLRRRRWCMRGGCRVLRRRWTCGRIIARLRWIRRMIMILSESKFGPFFTESAVFSASWQRARYLLCIAELHYSGLRRLIIWTLVPLRDHNPPPFHPPLHRHANRLDSSSAVLTSSVWTSKVIPSGTSTSNSRSASKNPRMSPKSTAAFFNYQSTSSRDTMRNSRS